MAITEQASRAASLIYWFEELQLRLSYHIYIRSLQENPRATHKTPEFHSQGP